VASLESRWQVWPEHLSALGCGQGPPAHTGLPATVVTLQGGRGQDVIPP
jgi:hypothetical protein